jgi:polyhydroxybutyrate depolymerase
MTKAALLVILLLGCGDDDGAAPGDDGGGDGQALGDPCAAGAPTPPEDERRTIEHGGLPRMFDVHVPPSYDGSALPLVLNFHGYTSNALQQAAYSAMLDKANAAGFVAVHGEGTMDPQRWNAGDCCPNGNSTVDDIGFVRAMIADVEAHVCIDPARIYATGMSNGGMISHRLGCEAADRIAAIAPVAGTLVFEACTPSRPVPVMAFHGTSDPVIPYEGGIFTGAPASHMRWGDLDGCTGTPVETYANGDTTCETYQTCQAGAQVTLCTVTGGGHTWPGADIIIGATTQDIDATDAMWDFFQAHPLP